MKTRLYLSIAGVFVGALLLSACGDALWHAAQLPGLRGVNERMRERATQQRLAGDPLRELAENTAQGDYRFRGLMDSVHRRTWVPGVPEGSFPPSHAQYLGTNPEQTWTSAAERYFTTYNRALVAQRRGKRFDSWGVLAP